ncbi:type IV secretory system conjugative DNA transfer family protein [Bacillus sp. JJ864]|uniref:type IV secretory system conjugative DNA transfer family protein n=1 Tax=Bacillus sp. JJ864 TaxID=3122975 RepID=UPI002FFDC358
MTELRFENENTLVVAPTGSGVKQSYIIPSIIENKNKSLVVVDLENQFWDLTHEIKVNQGYKVGKLDFVDFKGWGFNPLSFVKNDEDAQRLANITARNALVGGKEEFFQERARTLLKNMIVYTKANFSPENANFDSLISTYDKYISNEKTYMKWIEEQDQEDVGVQGLKSFFNSLTGKTRSSVTSSFDSIISLYRLEKIREMTKKSDFEFDYFVNNKYALYIKIASPINPYMGITSLFFTQMIDAFFKIARKNPNSQLPIPVNFLLSSFSSIGKLEDYDKILAICLKHSMNMTTIVDDLIQVKETYGEEVFKSILANHQNKLEIKQTNLSM